MNLAAIVKGLAVSVAVLGFCLAQPLLASTPVKQSPVVVDVALGQGGVFLGQVVDTNGAVKANVPVSLRLGNRELAQAKADAKGYFAFSGLRGGVYQVIADKGVASCRVWAGRTAPPTAQKVALVVSGQGLVRGQYRNFFMQSGNGLAFRNVLVNPIVAGGILTSAVAVPVGIQAAEKKQVASP